MIETTSVYDSSEKVIEVSLERAKEIYKKDHLSVYPRKFFNDMVRLRGWQREVGERIVEEWGVRSAVDFGCASGYYLEGMMKKGAKIKGYEYSYDSLVEFIPDEVKEYIFFGDVQTNLVNEKFDLSFSIEVAEHILPECSEMFIKNLTKSSNKYIVLSAARPGQKGTGHINLREFSYWVDLLEKQNFQYSQSGEKKVRSIFRSVNGRRYSKFLSGTVSFFEKIN